MPIIDQDLARTLDGLPYGEADKEALRRLLMRAFHVEHSAYRWLIDEHVGFGEPPLEVARRSRNGLQEIWDYLRVLGGVVPGSAPMIQK